MPPRQRRLPQDRQPKASVTASVSRDLAVKNGLTPFQFEHDGTVYELPAPDQDKAGQLHGQMVRDAVMNPGDQMAQLRLSIATVEASVTSQATLDALYAKPWNETVDIINGWITAATGADPGKSPNSAV